MKLNIGRQQGEQGRAFRGRRPASILAISVVALAALAVAAPAGATVGRTAYVTKESAGKVTPFTLGTGTLQTEIPVGTTPNGIAITPDGTTAYVVNQGSGTVTPINLATRTAGTAITVGSGPYGIAITPDGKTAYVTNSGDVPGTVTPIDIATNTAGSAITVGSHPAFVAIAPDGKTAYVTNSTNGSTVTPIDTATNTTKPDITVGTNPYGIAITPDGKTAYVATFGSPGTVVPIDLATGTPGTPIPVGPQAYGVAITPNGKTAYVSRSGYDIVVPIDLTTNTAGADIAVTSSPRDIAVSPNGRTAYVVGLFSNDVTPIHTATNTTGSPIPLADTNSDFPIGIAIAPNQGPTAAFDSTPAASGSPTSFDASASADPDGFVRKYHWRFGDGTGATTSSPTTSHTYATGGYYKATLRVTDNEGCSDALVFTGQTASCTGSAAARIPHRVPVAPSIHIDSGPPDSGSPDATFTYSSDDPGARFRCFLVGVDPSWGPCPPPHSYTGLAPGDYDFRVRALDGPNNHSAVADWNWTIN